MVALLADYGFVIGEDVSRAQISKHHGSFLDILLIIGSELSSDAQMLSVKAARREMMHELGFAVWVNHTIVSLWSVLMHIRMIMLSMEYFL